MTIIPIRIRNYGNIFESIERKKESSSVDYEKSWFNIQQKWERAKCAKTEIRVSGRMILEKILETLERVNSIPDKSDPREGKWRMSDSQDEYSIHFLVSILPMIYKSDELLEDLPWLMKKLNFKSFKSITLLTTPRRFGKTTMIAILATVFAYCIPNLVIPVFANVQRSSQRIAELIKEILIDLGGGTDTLIKVSNSEKLYVFNAWGGISKIFALPASKIRFFYFSFFL